MENSTYELFHFLGELHIVFYYDKLRDNVVEKWAKVMSSINNTRGV